MPPSVTDVAPVDTLPAVVTDTTLPSAADAESEPARAGPVVLDMARLRSAISSNMDTFRYNALAQDLQECRRYRERYASRDCPEGEEPKSATQERIDANMNTTFRAWVGGYTANRRIVRELEADMDRLRPLLEDTGVLGEVARTQYYLKAGQHVVLQPPVAEDAGIRILTIGSGGISVLSNFLTISFDGEVRTGEQANGPARTFDETAD